MSEVTTCPVCGNAHLEGQCNGPWAKPLECNDGPEKCRACPPDFSGVRPVHGEPQPAKEVPGSCVPHGRVRCSECAYLAEVTKERDELRLAKPNAGSTDTLTEKYRLREQVARLEAHVHEIANNGAVPYVFAEKIATLERELAEAKQVCEDNFFRVKDERERADRYRAENAELKERNESLEIALPSALEQRDAARAELSEQKEAYEFLWKMRVQDEKERI